MKLTVEVEVPDGLVAELFGLYLHGIGINELEGSVTTILDDDSDPAASLERGETVLIDELMDPTGEHTKVRRVTREHFVQTILNDYLNALDNGEIRIY